MQNAIKFTHAGGTVSIRAGVIDKFVSIEVEDRCGGLSEDVKQRMFDPPLHRAHNARSSGFGLAIARRAVEAHGGTLRVSDLPSVGCVFTILMPRSQRLLE